MHRRLLPAAIVILLAANIAAQAQAATAQAAPAISAEKLALIRELIQLTNSKEIVDGVLKAQLDQLEKDLPEMVWQSISNMPELKGLTFSQTAELKEKVAGVTVNAGRRMYDLLREKVDFVKVVEDISGPVYDKYFTVDELAALVAFYKTPTGKRVLEVSPKLYGEFMSRASEIVMPKVLDAMRQLAAEETQRATDEIQTTLKSFQKQYAKPPQAKPSRRVRH